MKFFFHRCTIFSYLFVDIDNDFYLNISSSRIAFVSSNFPPFVLVAICRVSISPMSGNPWRSDGD